MLENRDMILIHRFLSGALSDVELLAFNRRLVEDTRFARLLHKTKQIWDASKPEAINVPTSPPEVAWNRFALAAGIGIEKPKSARPVIKGWRFAAAAAVLLLLTATFFLIGRVTKAQTITVSADEAPLELSLPDGSTVKLNAHSLVTYSEAMDARQRKIFLEGEASFEVVAHPDRPFIVETDQTTAEVLGTTFILAEGEDRTSTKLYVLEGLVRFTPRGSSKYLDIEKGNGAVYDHRVSSLQRQRNPSFNDVAWYTRTLRFNQTPMKDVFSDLKKFYDVEFDTSKSKIQSCRLISTQVYYNASLGQILDAIRISFNVTIEKQAEGLYSVKGGSCE